MKKVLKLPKFLLVSILLIIIVSIANSNYFKHFIFNNYQQKLLKIEDLSIKDFTMQPDGTLISTSNDSWLEIKNINMPIYALEYNLKYSSDVNTNQVFYTDQENSSFSEKLSKTDIFKKNEQGNYRVYLNHIRPIKDLRLDITNTENVKIKFNSIIINPKPKFVIPYKTLLFIILLLAKIGRASCRERV